MYAVELDIMRRKRDGTGEYNPDKDPYESYKGMYDK